jgi:AcrR family transcriptional regulator
VGNKIKTKEKILSALGRLLSRAGFEHLGINSIAREAGVDKVLIYRYFGGLRELFMAFASQGGFWPGVDALLGAKTRKGAVAALSAEELSSLLLIRHLQELLARPLTQNIMCWELLAQNELTRELAGFREDQGRNLLALPQFRGKENDDMDIPAVGALLMAGISYLILRSNTAPVYMGVKLDSKTGWKRMEKAIKALVHAYFQYNESKNQAIK